MGHLETLFTFFLFSLVSWVGADDSKYETFFNCISNNSLEGKQILERFYVPNSKPYNTSLDFAEQNRRWFTVVDQQPYLVMNPYKQSEIQPVIWCSKKIGLQVRAKSGGHDYEGLSYRSSTKTPFVMIDLVNLTSIDINVQEETAWIETGVTLGQLYYAIANKSNTLAFPAGLYSSVGSGGHISGGGLGMIMRKYGLAADNVIDALIMDVNGNILNRREMGPDLFWAIRGGGGASFGVILAWKLKLVRVPEQVTSFTIRRKLEAGPTLELLQKWQNIAYKLPKDLFIRVLLFGNFNSVDGKFVKLNFNGLYLGPANELESILNTTFPEFDLQTQDCFTFPPVNIARKDCLQTSWIRSVFYFMGANTSSSREDLLSKDNIFFRSTYEKATSDFLTTPIPDEGWLMIREKLITPNDQFYMMILDPLGGVMDEIPTDSSPFPYRNGTLYSVQYLSQWHTTNETDATTHISWLTDMYQKMEPYVSKSPRSAYLNYKDLGLGQNDEQCSYEQAKVWGEKYFKSNFERLARVKGKVDPQNFFKNEQSIPVLV